MSRRKNQNEEKIRRYAGFSQNPWGYRDKEIPEWEEEIDELLVPHPCAFLG
jgi:hypothetical protein